jgi:hypothetical protein
MHKRRISQAEKDGNPGRKLKTVKELVKNHRRIELCMREIILRFEMNL